MNRGINDQSDLPDEFLSRIYDDISENEIKTNPCNQKRPRLSIIRTIFKFNNIFIIEMSIRSAIF